MTVKAWRTRFWHAHMSIWSDKKPQNAPTPPALLHVNRPCCCNPTHLAVAIQRTSPLQVNVTLVEKVKNNAFEAICDIFDIAK